ncbi:tRNA/rRNA methyltransferase (SpoU) [Desulfovibrio sp. X2]|uniref:TrmH family RNA methyltransferase n=1 Tax=Desulfovibrio sp. X2 TaxID=941449 RepID=UPI000358AF4B|nr:TrmH family RNA methyltransferase [Desulfovibrio sp. X2]EPR42413.1 tRNA/rRNA methyltransferase (SpoU) [Desulfovibrio sp. X2]
MRTRITERRKDRIREVLEKRQKDLTLVIDHVWDPHNVSAILRSCDAFGVPQVHLYYKDEAFPDIGRKSSASAGKWVRRMAHTDAAAMAASLKADGMRLLATGFTEDARPLTEWDLTSPVAVILSNEHSGVRPELLPHCDGMVYIPMSGMVQSFNVSVAAALILYETWRQRSAKGMYDRPSYSDDELETLYRDWCSR